jgi:hypothetical protein
VKPTRKGGAPRSANNDDEKTPVAMDIVIAMSCVVSEHRHCFGRGETVCDPWHYVPVLVRKPGALRNGAPFKDWVLPVAMEPVRRRRTAVDDGDRQMVTIPTAVLSDGLGRVEAAALRCGARKRPPRSRQACDLARKERRPPRK